MSVAVPGVSCPDGTGNTHDAARNAVVVADVPGSCLRHRAGRFHPGPDSPCGATLTLPAPAVCVMKLGNILGNGQDRPPAPEVATAEDVEKYNMQWVSKNPQAATDTGTEHSDPTVELPFTEKALDDRLKQKAEFPWLYDPSKGVRWDFDPVQLRNIAQENTWVGMMVQSITKEIAETPWSIVKQDDRNELRKRLSEHPETREKVAKQEGATEFPDATAERIDDLLRNPNPDHGWHDLVEMWLGDLLEVGSATTVKAFPKSVYGGENNTLAVEPDATRPRALQVSAPEVWTKGFDGRTGIMDAFWQFDDERAPGTGNSNGGTSGSYGFRTPVEFDTAEVMWTDMTPRSNRRYGMPPTLLVRDFLQSLDLAVKQEQQYLSRGSIPSGAWVFEQWDREEVREWKTENAENIKGKPHKSLMFAGRGGDVKFEPMSMNFKELEFTERMKWYARVVSSVFQVPTAVVGIEPEKVNYNTFQGERENFEENTLGPYMQKLERFINDELIWPHWGRSYHFEFKPGLSETTRSKISGRVQSEFNAGLIRRNEARQELGRDEVDEDLNGFKDEVVEGTDPQDAQDALGGLMASEMSDEGNEGNANLRKDEALRNSGEWYQFDVQPEMVETLQQDIADDVSELFESVLSNERIQTIIERLAAESEQDDADAVSKSTVSLAREVRKLLEQQRLAGDVADAIRNRSAEAIRETLQETVTEADDTDVDVDVEAVTSRLQDRDVAFADRFANELSETIRDTVGDGWAEGKNSREIAADIAEEGDIAEGWGGAERIARQELQVATGEARSAVADDLDKVEIWNDSGDNRVRQSHADMDGKWAFPGDEWLVDYSDEGRGVVKESAPGSSEPGIGCRCTTLLRDREEVADEDYAGDGDLN
ncbi:portal [Haloarcula sinaiiensis tailed virus 1]|uniref:Portal n=1 Tax=Haloarcula sinaiiensis tailed virus 1 TaxID=1262530 RepID=R9QT34_9CAUD|nr:head morphogenesis [Haloarcula sinaiiensis tailed virus 1]AGC34548.1 portal [Haloarcula sinaiiensis tailed virus 1]